MITSDASNRTNRKETDLTTQRGVAAWGLVVVISAGALAEDARTRFAHELLDRARASDRVVLETGPELGSPESYRIDGRSSPATIRGGGPAGILYGVADWLQAPTASRTVAEVRPDFELRGTVLFLMKEATYDFQLTPEEFPWFYDRPLLLRYFDYLFANRFNTLFLWSGHLFPSIVEMPEYSDATDLSRERLLRNQEQFKWFTDECARRNIRVLLHFYQIHIPKALAKSRNIPVQYSKPDEFVTGFVRYSLEKFLAKFESVGLYVCPGEALASEYQPEWIRDVIFAAAKQSGKRPVIVVRDWTLDADRFTQICKDEYDNLYTELKHNVEMIVSPVPDERHARWKGVAKKHIVNLHEVADVKPFRWGSPRFIQEMAGHWKRIGLDGAEVYGMISWRWPYALDKLEPGQAGYWPEGKKLLTFERDAIWLEAVGRYLWKVDREPNEEEAFWSKRLGAKFGSSEAGRLLLAWYDTTGPILPGLQNLTHVRNMNWFPTAIGKEQMVDSILNTQACDRDYPARPIDAGSFERYKRLYNLPGLMNRIAMPVAEYAERTAKKESTAEAMTPDRVADLYLGLAEEGLGLARQMERAALLDREEATRFVSDSQALVLVAQAWRHKIRAAIAKRVFQRTGDPQEEKTLRTHLGGSITAYEQLVALTDRTYVNATDMVMRLNWHNGLTQFRADVAAQERFLAAEKARRAPGVCWLETEDMDGNWSLGTNYPGYSGTGFRVSNGPDQKGTPLSKVVAINKPGRHVVWARGLQAGDTDRAFCVEFAGTKFPPSHAAPGPKEGEFVWTRLGEVELTPGSATLIVRDAGQGFECPDVIVIADSPGWRPPR